MHEAQIIFFIGPPGAGKSTLSEAVASHLPMCAFFSPSAFLCELEENETDVGLFVRDNATYQDVDPLVTEAVMREIAHAMYMNHYIVIDGFPRTAQQMALLPRICNNHRFLVFSLTNIGLDLCLGRVYLRNSEMGAGSDDGQITELRYKAWEEEYHAMHKQMISMDTATSVEHILDAHYDVDILVDRVRRILEECSGAIVPYATFVPDKNTPPPLTDATQLETAAVIARILLLSCAQTTRKKFPGSHPVSLERQYFKNIYDHPYLISRKIQGVRFLALIRDGYCWLMRRDLRVWRSYWRPELLAWNDTLLDVEIATPKGRDPNTHHCVVLDVLSSQGRCVMQVPILQRLYSAQDIMKGGHLADLFEAGASFQQYFDRADLRFALLLDFDFDTDGVIFTPLSLPYRHTQDRNMFKWKPAVENSVDLLHRQGRVYVRNNDDDTLVDFGLVVDVTDQARRWLNMNVIGEFRAQYLSQSSASKHRWVPIRPREDKPFPNPEWVARRICTSISENITLEQICSMNGVR